VKKGTKNIDLKLSVMLLFLMTVCVHPIFYDPEKNSRSLKTSPKISSSNNGSRNFETQF